VLTQRPGTRRLQRRRRGKRCLLSFDAVGTTSAEWTPMEPRRGRLVVRRDGCAVRTPSKAGTYTVHLVLSVPGCRGYLRLLLFGVGGKPRRQRLNESGRRRERRTRLHADEEKEFSLLEGLARTLRIRPCTAEATQQRLRRKRRPRAGGEAFKSAILKVKPEDVKFAEEIEATTQRRTTDHDTRMRMTVTETPHFTPANTHRI